MTGACESDWVVIAELYDQNLTRHRTGYSQTLGQDWNHVWDTTEALSEPACSYDWCQIAYELWSVRGDVIESVIESMIEGVAQSELRLRFRIWNPVLAKRSAYSQNFWELILEQFSGQIFSDSETRFNSSLTWLIQNHVRNLRAVLARFVQVFSCVMSQILLFKPTYPGLYFVQVFES